MDVSQAVDQRISIRAFLPDPLSEADVREWLSQAQRAPSGGNLQPWRTIAVTGQAKDDVIAMVAPILAADRRGQKTDYPVYPKDLWEPYEGRRRKVGEMMYETLGIPREDRAARIAWFSNNFRFFGAPLALFIVLDERMGHGQWGHAGMYLQTLALLAEERGWGTCFQECWGALRPALKTHFNLAPTEMIWCGVAVGKPDKTHPVNTLRAERADLDDVVEFHGF